MEQSKLPALGYTSILEALGERFHASPALLQALNPNATFAAGEQIQVPNVQRAPLAGVAKVIVDQSDHAVIAQDEAGKVIARYPATMGSEHDPLPVGRVEDHRHVEGTAGVLLQPRAVLGRRRDAQQGEDRAGAQQSGRARVDRPVEGALWDPRHPAAREHRQDAVARLHPSHQLGRHRAGSAVKPGIPAVLQE